MIFVLPSAFALVFLCVGGLEALFPVLKTVGVGRLLGVFESPENHYIDKIICVIVLLYVMVVYVIEYL